MKQENAYPIALLMRKINEMMPSYQITAGRIIDVDNRINKIQREKPEKVTMIIGSTTAEVPWEVAVNLLKEAFEAETKQAELYTWRLDKAHQYLSGEYDVDYDN